MKKKTTYFRCLTYEDRFSRGEGPLRICLAEKGAAGQISLSFTGALTYSKVFMLMATIKNFTRGVMLKNQWGNGRLLLK